MSIDTYKLAIHRQLNLVCLELEQLQFFLTRDAAHLLVQAKEAYTNQHNEAYALSCIVQWAGRGFVDYPHIKLALDEADAVLKAGAYPPEPEVSSEEQVHYLKAKQAMERIESTPLKSIDSLERD